MPVELKPSEHKLEGLFDYTKIEKFYIPEFQRPYAWGIEHTRKKWWIILWTTYVLESKEELHDESSQIHFITILTESRGVLVEL